MRVKNKYTQQQSNETHNYEMPIKLHTMHKMHTTLLLNVITEYSVHRGNSDIE